MSENRDFVTNTDVLLDGEALRNLVRNFTEIVRNSPPPNVARCTHTEMEARMPDNLSTDAVDIICYVLRAAGHECCQLVPKILKGHYCDQDGSSTGTFPINASCPYTVRSMSDDLLDVRPEDTVRDNYAATKWLDDIVRNLLALDHGFSPCSYWNLPLSSASSSEQVIDRVVDHIVASRPLPPIVLTPYGDALVEVAPENNVHRRDGDLLRRNSTGVHARCHGYINSIPCSDDFRVLVCMTCHFRYYAPVAVKTFGDLRAYAAKRLQQVSLW